MRASLNKYRNKRTSFAGRSFASQLERDVFAHLRILGYKDSQIQQQDHIRLTRANIVYVADFKVAKPDASEGYIWVEAKGYDTDVWKLKARLWEFYGPGLLYVMRRRGKSDVFIERVIQPKTDPESLGA